MSETTASPFDRPYVLRSIVGITFDDLCKQVAQKHKISVDDLVGRSRLGVHSAARQELMTEMWISGMAFAEIGRKLGRDHTTVMYGVDRALDERKRAEL